MLTSMLIDKGIRSITVFLSYLRFLIPYGMLSLLCMTESLQANEKATLDDALSPVAKMMSGVIFYKVSILGQPTPVVLILLVAAALWLTLHLKFISLRGFGLAIRTIRGRYTQADDPGVITHFQAICTSLSATVGLGNIAGVATAIGIGGPGAAFWMLVMGFFGMATKFAECTLGVTYRIFDSNKQPHGGPMYYLEHGLKEKGLKKLGKFLAIFFALMCAGGSLGAGNMYQINQATSQFTTTFGTLQGDSSWIFGLIIALLIGFVIIGGIKSIARVTSFLVPFMCVTYVIAAMIILFMHYTEIPAACVQIVSSAFSPVAVGGGFIGVLIQGVQRAVFSNEAGVGSAPIAHAAVKTRHPASEGYVAMLGPFIDTVVVCMMTALVLVVSGTWKVDAKSRNDAASLYDQPSLESSVVRTVTQQEPMRIIKVEKKKDKKFGAVWQSDGADVLWVDMDQVTEFKGIKKTSLAFEKQFAWFPIILSCAVILFAISTMISWSYYGEQAVDYLFGSGNKVAILTYKLIFCLFVVIGSAISLENVLNISDAMIFAMVLPNIIGLYILLPKIKQLVTEYHQHVREVDRS